MTPIPSVEEEIRRKHYHAVQDEINRRAVAPDEAYATKIHGMSDDELHEERLRLMREGQF